MANAKPSLIDRFLVTQQGGWLDHYRDRTRASHNFRLDPAAAGLALRVVTRPRLLLSDFTGVDDITITPDSELYRMLTTPEAPEWARWLAVNLARWFDLGKPSRMHDPLALSAARGLRFVRFKDCRVRIESDARLYRDPGGRQLEVATDVAYRPFMAWLTYMLREQLNTDATDPRSSEDGAARTRKPFSANQRRILEAMSDGGHHRTQELYERLGLPRLSSAARTVNWFARHGYIQRADNDDDAVAWLLTAKGSEAAASLDHGYELGYDGLPV
ncbi:helix-turn-helix domain-containing protein [Nocardia sp. NPDC050193]